MTTPSAYNTVAHLRAVLLSIIRYGHPVRVVGDVWYVFTAPPPGFGLTDSMSTEVAARLNDRMVYTVMRSLANSSKISVIRAWRVVTEQSLLDSKNGVEWLASSTFDDFASEPDRDSGLEIQSVERCEDGDGFLVTINGPSGSIKVYSSVVPDFDSIVDITFI